MAIALNTEELKNCLSELESILPVIQKAVPQLRVLIGLAEALGSVTINSEKPADKPPEYSAAGTRRSTTNGYAKPIGTKDPESTISRIEVLLKESPKPLSPSELLGAFRAKGWRNDADDQKLRGAISGTLYHLKSVAKTIQGSAVEGYRLVKG